VGRIRYLGVVLYDAERIKGAASAPDHELVEKQKEIILDPFDPGVIAQAERNGVHHSVVESAQKSPVYRFVKEWELALPLRPEFRTLPMLFYIPPLLPVLGYVENGTYQVDAEDYFGSLDKARVPLKYMARLFTAGNEDAVRQTYEKLLTVRLFKRAEQVGDIDQAQVDSMMESTGLTPESCEEIFRLTSLPTFDERFVIPPMHREYAIEMIGDPQSFKEEVGVGVREKPKRGL
jgi:nitrate reductase beta subunit